jgi:hypothetical protein
MDLARAPRRAPLTARKKGSGYENGMTAAWHGTKAPWQEKNRSFFRRTHEQINGFLI